MALQDAINNVEAASTALSNANTNQAAAQQKFDAAQAVKTQADADDATAVTNFNSSLDALIAEAQAAKIPVSTSSSSSTAGVAAPASS